VRPGIAFVALVASVLSACNGAGAVAKPYSAVLVKTAFARAGITSYLTQASGSRSGRGFHEGDATLTLSLAPHCPMPNDFFSASLSSSTLIALESRRTLIFTRCHRDWVAVVFFQTTAAAGNKLRATRGPLASSSITVQADRNILVLYRAAAASEAASALGKLH
jgi:hypothetical protein